MNMNESQKDMVKLLLSIPKLARKGNRQAQDLARALSLFFNEANMDLSEFHNLCNNGAFLHAYGYYDEFIYIFIKISADETQFKKLAKEYSLSHSIYSTAIASHLETSAQFQKYHNERAGHGFAAEDANALNDFLHGRSVEKTGLSNELDGPDRIVDGISIQTKYYATAEKSVASAFRDGKYRYQGQKLEVPADQYEEALACMREQIRKGNVADRQGKRISDPDEAANIVHKGSVTYEQAKNIAKAGNIDSITFDFKNQCVSSSCVFGISFVTDYARSKWSGKTNADAMRGALGNAMQSSLASAVSGIISSQILRTKAAAGGTVVMRRGVKLAARTSLGKSAIEAVAKASLGKGIYGAAAVNHVSKLLRSNVATAVITASVSMAPDFYRAAIAKNISWGQFSKNLAVNAAGVAGGAGGWFAGAAAGAAAGSIIPGVGNAVGAAVGGFIGAFSGGALASKAAKSVADKIREDDAVMMVRLTQAQAEQHAYDYMLTEAELNQFSEFIKSSVTPDWLRKMYASGSSDASRKRYAAEAFSSYCDGLLAKRPKIFIPKNDDIFNQIEEELEDSLIREKIQSYNKFDPRRKYYRIKKSFAAWRKKMAKKPAGERIGRIIGAGIVIFAFYCIAAYCLDLWPKTTLIILGLLFIGWYVGDEEKDQKRKMEN